MRRLKPICYTLKKTERAAGLIKFLDDIVEGKRTHFDQVDRPHHRSAGGCPAGVAYSFEDYRDKVNRYVNEHGDTLAIYKLTHNIPFPPEITVSWADINQGTCVCDKEAIEV